MKNNFVYVLQFAEGDYYTGRYRGAVAKRILAHYMRRAGSKKTMLRNIERIVAIYPINNIAEAAMLEGVVTVETNRRRYIDSERCSYIELEELARVLKR